YPFRAWPIGLHAMLEPVLFGNPFLDALAVVEVLEPRTFVTTVGELLFVPERAEAMRGRQEAYRRRVSSLPRGAERFQSLLRGCGAGGAGAAPSGAAPA